MSLNDQLTSDLSIFINTDDFAEEVIFNINGEELPVDAIFDDSFYDNSIGDVLLESSQPRLTCNASEVSSVSKSDTVTVRNIEYDVLQKQPDDTGMITILLANKKQ